MAVDETVIPEVVEVDYKALSEELATRIEKLDANNKELLTEKQKTQKQRDEAKAEAQRIADEHALKNGQFEDLWKASEEKAAYIKKQYDELHSGLKQEKIKNAAMKLAVETANNAENAELLAVFIEMEIKTLADDSGAVQQDVLKALQAKYRNDKKYASLVVASKAVGGSATGSGSSTAVAPDTTNMSPTERINAFRAGK